MDPVADPSPSRRSVKRRPPARSPELSPKSGGGEAPELIRRVEELEASAARLRGEKEAAEEAARGLQTELEAERASAETAASEAMLMIERLQREKAAAQMEARQFRCYAESRRRREIALLRAERAQLVMARGMARRLCWEVVAEQRSIVKKTASPAGSFSVLPDFGGALDEMDYYVLAVA